MARDFASAVRPLFEAQLEHGERFKLMMMRGGSSLFGGEEQADGVVALAEWLAASRPVS